MPCGLTLGSKAKNCMRNFLNALLLNTGRLPCGLTQEVFMNNDFYQDLNKLAKKNAVVLFGSTMDWLIPVSELAQSF